ncbi:hypothetical protein KKG48_02275 [Patescibacteria group bacterium]|nr:hypothetical protein [Patescibacteria group bacterium]
MSQKKWELTIGCHCDTKESLHWEIREHDTLRECKDDVLESERQWRKEGKCFWFANAVGHDGTKIKLHTVNPPRL